MCISWIFIPGYVSGLAKRQCCDQRILSIRIAASLSKATGDAKGPLAMHVCTFHEIFVKYIV